jgi:ABC-2 type transport system permease protein
MVVSTALYGAAGVAVGALLRNQTIAVSAVLVWVLAVEGLIGDLLPDNDVVRWLPAAAGRALVHVGPGGSGLPTPVAAGVFTLYIAALAGAGARLTLHRDIT